MPTVLPLQFRQASSPIPSSGLSLWLKADAGVATLQSTYVSQIVLTCTGGLSSYSGTYNARSDPDVDGFYSLFSSANFKDIYKESFGSNFTIGPDFPLASSGDGISWSLANVLVVGLTISGATGSYTGANGAYGLNERDASDGDIYNDNGYYGLVNTSGAVEIYSPTFVLLYSNSSFGSGAWTNEGGTGTVTASSIQLDPSGTASGSVTTSDYANSNVTGWADQSGNSRNFTKSIANTGFPTFSNGAVLFTSSSTYDDPNASILALPSASLNLTGPYTLITVFRAGANNSAVFNKSNNDSKRRKYQIAVNGGSIYALESTNGEDNYIVYDTGTGNDVNIKRLIVSQFTSNTDGIIRYNGAEVAVGDGNGPNGEYGYGLDEINSASVCIGAAAFGEGGGYNAEASTEMYVYEIIFYNRAITTPEIQQVEAYLNDKYVVF